VPLRCLLPSGLLRRAAVERSSSLLATGRNALIKKRSDALPVCRVNDPDHANFVTGEDHDQASITVLIEEIDLIMRLQGLRRAQLSFGLRIDE
jgi:hypothetical protein